MKISRLARIIAIAIAALGVVLSSISLSAPAHADARIGPAGYVSYDLLCEDGRITISPFMSVQNGYTGGQWMVYRYWVTDAAGTTGTSGWSGTKLMPYATSYLGTTTYYDHTLHTNAVYPAARGRSWGVWIQVGYWNPRTASYSYTGWYSQPRRTVTLTARYSGMSAMTPCMT